MKRQEFLTTVIGATAAIASVQSPGALVAGEPVPSAKRLPRWRGFNLLEKFTKRKEGNPPFRETDFAWMSEWGFDFARLPMSYLCWADAQDWLKFQEGELEHIDAALEHGRKHGVHLNLNFHRAPGYCVNPPKEPLDLWSDERALDAGAKHWQMFARRYKGIPNTRLSFDLLNEPPDISETTYVRVVKRFVEAIRSEHADRLIIADGLRWGREPVHGLVDLNVGQSTRGYDPMQVSHYKANWVSGADRWPAPAWPLLNDRDAWDRERLQRERIVSWKNLETKGVGIHVGEWGAFNQTDHRTALAWMRDQLDLWKDAGWGWALWNFRGAFGILNSGRSDVKYEDYRGERLDRQMLNLLRKGSRPACPTPRSSFNL
jgi:endoglucanase